MISQSTNRDRVMWEKTRYMDNVSSENIRKILQSIPLCRIDSHRLKDWSVLCIVASDKNHMLRSDLKVKMFIRGYLV